jgi:hypothetical protein
MGWDPGSKKKPFRDTGVKKHRFRIRIPNTEKKTSHVTIFAMGTYFLNMCYVVENIVQNIF